MISVSARILALSFSWVVLSAPLLSAQDLSKYREFQLGMGLAAAAQKTGVTPVARGPHQPPELIQELIVAAPKWSRRITAWRLGTEGPPQFLQRRAVSNRGQLRVGENRRADG